ncbi:MAG: hypothetical protein AB7V13_16335 [Pseudorhodoplanes sp.]
MHEVESLIVRRIAVEMEQREPGAHRKRLDPFHLPANHPWPKSKRKPRLAAGPSLAFDRVAMQRALTALLLTGLLLPAMLTALTRILGLLAGLVLPALAALLAALIRIVLLLLALVAFVSHLEAPG